MINFYNTLAGKQFFSGDIPRVAKALELQNTLKIYELYKNNQLELSEDEVKSLLKKIRGTLNG